MTTSPCALALRQPSPSRRRAARPGWRALLVRVAVVAVAGCAHLPNTDLHEVDGHRVELITRRHPGPVVVFESGLGGQLDWWTKVWPEVSREHAALAYNRPGYGRSDPPTTPRDGRHVVDELRALLRQQDLPPPYVLVGHSLGGLTMQLFARAYPQEVQALVLVDSTNPRPFAATSDRGQWPAWARSTTMQPTLEAARQELAAVGTTAQQVLDLPAPPPSVKVIVLSALNAQRSNPALAGEAHRRRAELASLYPGSTQVWVDSGHGIPLEKPDAVIDAVRDATAAPAR